MRFGSKFNKIAILITTLLGANQFAFAQISLQEILKTALVNDPSLLEAKAKVAEATAQTNISKSKHLPTLQVLGNQILANKQKNKNIIVEKNNIGLQTQVNLFSWGAINDEINRDSNKQDFQSYKYEEAKELLGKKIADLYLKALQARETISVYQESLKSHTKIIGELNSIVKLDSGRKFELYEAQARQIKVTAVISDQKRILNLTLNQLNRYFPNKKISADDLVDPFANTTPKQIISKFKNDNLLVNPSFLAQQKEVASEKFAKQAQKAKLLPALNLVGNVTNQGRQVYLNVNWDILNEPNRHNAEKSAQSEVAAKAKLEDIKQDILERTQSAIIDMQENVQRIDIFNKQQQNQKTLINNYHQQFLIARKSLLDLLNSYRDLSDIQVTLVNAHNDYRNSVLNYLLSQAHIASWAGINKFVSKTKRFKNQKNLEQLIKNHSKKNN